MSDPSSTRPDGEGQELLELRREMEALRADLAHLRQELATEVRTRRLVVVDELGVERVYTTLTRDITSLYVDCPAGPCTSGVSIQAAWDEECDAEERPMGHSSVTVWSKGNPGAQISASDVDGAPVFTEVDGVQVERAAIVDGVVIVFDRAGEEAISMVPAGLRVRP